MVRPWPTQACRYSYPCPVYYDYQPAPPAFPPLYDYAVPEVEVVTPPSLGWVYGPYTSCIDPSCGTVVVNVGVDGLNVRTFPDGPIVLALANGVPLLPLQRQGDWVLVAAGCSLSPTWTASVTAGGIPLSVCF
jgi:hypothetical protein